MSFNRLRPTPTSDIPLREVGGGGGGGAHSPGMLSLLDQYTTERVPDRLQCACRRSAPATGSARKVGYGTDGAKRCSNCDTQTECSAAVRQSRVTCGSSSASLANCAQSAGGEKNLPITEFKLKLRTQILKYRNNKISTQLQHLSVLVQGLHAVLRVTSLKTHHTHTHTHHTQCSSINNTTHYNLHNRRYTCQLPVPPTNTATRHLVAANWRRHLAPHDKPRPLDHSYPHSTCDVILDSTYFSLAWIKSFKFIHLRISWLQVRLRHSNFPCHALW